MGNRTSNSLTITSEDVGNPFAPPRLRLLKQPVMPGGNDPVAEFRIRLMRIAREVRALPFIDFWGKQDVADLKEVPAALSFLYSLPRFQTCHETKKGQGHWQCETYDLRGDVFHNMAAVVTNETSSREINRIFRILYSATIGTRAYGADVWRARTRFGLPELNVVQEETVVEKAAAPRFNVLDSSPDVPFSDVAHYVEVDIQAFTTELLYTSNPEHERRITWDDFVYNSDMRRAMINVPIDILTRMIQRDEKAHGWPEEKQDENEPRVRRRIFGSGKEFRGIFIKEAEHRLSTKRHDELRRHILNGNIPHVLPSVSIYARKDRPNAPSPSTYVVYPDWTSPYAVSAAEEEGISLKERITRAIVHDGEEHLPDAARVQLAFQLTMALVGLHTHMNLTLTDWDVAFAGPGLWSERSAFCASTYDLGGGRPLLRLANARFFEDDFKGEIWMSYVPYVVSADLLVPYSGLDASKRLQALFGALASGKPGDIFRPNVYEQPLDDLSFGKPLTTIVRHLFLDGPWSAHLQQSASLARGLYESPLILRPFGNGNGTSLAPPTFREFDLMARSIPAAEPWDVTVKKWQSCILSTVASVYMNTNVHIESDGQLSDVQPIQPVNQKNAVFIGRVGRHGEQQTVFVLLKRHSYPPEIFYTNAPEPEFPSEQTFVARTFEHYGASRFDIPFRREGWLRGQKDWPTNVVNPIFKVLLYVHLALLNPTMSGTEVEHAILARHPSIEYESLDASRWVHEFEIGASEEAERFENNLRSSLADKKGDEGWDLLQEEFGQRRQKTVLRKNRNGMSLAALYQYYITRSSPLPLSPDILSNPSARGIPNWKTVYRASKAARQAYVQQINAINSEQTETNLRKTLDASLEWNEIFLAEEEPFALQDQYIAEHLIPWSPSVSGTDLSQKYRETPGFLRKLPPWGQTNLGDFSEDAIERLFRSRDHLLLPSIVFLHPFAHAPGSADAKWTVQGGDSKRRNDEEPELRAGMDEDENFPSLAPATTLTDETVLEPAETGFAGIGGLAV